MEAQGGGVLLSGFFIEDSKLKPIEVVISKIKQVVLEMV